MDDQLPALRLVGLRKHFGRPAVDGLDLLVRRGEFYALLGPNGAGKTTCFYSVMGLVKPDSGRIMLDGDDITRLPMYRRAILGLGYLPHETSIFRGLTIEKNILTVLELSEELGIGIEFSCRVGTCGVCKVKMTSGEVEMAVDDALEPDDKANHIILACQAKPTSDIAVAA